MKWHWLLLSALLAGCLASPGDDLVAPEGCAASGVKALYLDADHWLVPEPPEAGSVPGNGFAEAFLTNDLDEWLYPAQEQAYRIVGNVTLSFWAEGNNMPAPIIIGGGTGEGYHFFNQFGTDRGFVESYAIEYETAAPDTEVRHYEERFAMPVGGLWVEPGDRLRLLLTNLVLDDAEGAGPDILIGGDTPSAMTFTAVCFEPPVWQPVSMESTPVTVAANQGLLTGAVPAAADVNYADVPFTLDAATGRLTIRLEQTGGPTQPKSDMDLSVRDASGEVWSIGSPYTDEVGTKWPADLAATMPPGDYVVRVNSYSGTDYEGDVIVVQESA